MRHFLDELPDPSLQLLGHPFIVHGVSKPDEVRPLLVLRDGGVHAQVRREHGPRMTRHGSYRLSEILRHSSNTSDQSSSTNGSNSNSPIPGRVNISWSVTLRIVLASRLERGARRRKGWSRTANTRSPKNGPATPPGVGSRPTNCAGPAGRRGRGSVGRTRGKLGSARRRRWWRSGMG